MRYYNIFFTVALVMVCHLGAFAVGSTDDYQVEVVVKDRSQEVLEAAIPQALEAVLVKMSGDPEAVNDSSVRDHLLEAKRYVERYEYRPDPEDPSHHNLILQLKFSTKSLGELLQNLNPSQDVASAETISLHVYGVNSLSDFSEVVQYVRGLNSVTNVEASTVDSDDVILTVKSNAGMESLKKAIDNAGDHRLKPIEANKKSESDHEMLSYRWAV